MKGFIMIRWIDRQWDQYPNAVNWLGLIIAALCLPLIVIGWRPLTIAFAVLWAAFWTILFGWRWVVHLRRLDGKWQRGRKR